MLETADEVLIQLQEPGVSADVENSSSFLLGDSRKPEKQMKIPKCRAFIE